MIIIAEIQLTRVKKKNKINQTNTAWVQKLYFPIQFQYFDNSNIIKKLLKFFYLYIVNMFTWSFAFCNCSCSACNSEVEEAADSVADDNSFWNSEIFVRNSPINCCEHRNTNKKETPEL